jgi:hypothetical protein
MDLLNEIGPEFCSKTGLDCDSCVQRCASTTAAVCQDLQPYGAHRVFLQLYPSPACHPMAAAFVEAYQDAVAPSIPPAITMTRAARVTAAAAA